jgi:hypothetical protein
VGSGKPTYPLEEKAVGRAAPSFRTPSSRVPFPFPSEGKCSHCCFVYNDPVYPPFVKTSRQTQPRIRADLLGTSSKAPNLVFPSLLPGLELPSFRDHRTQHGPRPRPFAFPPGEAPARPSTGPIPNLLASCQHVSPSIPYFNTQC